MKQGDVCTVAMTLGRAKIYAPWTVTGLEGDRAVLSYGAMRATCPIDALTSQNPEQMQKILFDQAWG